MAVFTPSDRPKLVWNRCLSNFLVTFFVVVTLPLSHFRLYMHKGFFCHRTDSDIFLVSLDATGSPFSQNTYCVFIKLNKMLRTYACICMGTHR